MEGYRGKLAEMFGWPLTERFNGGNRSALDAALAQSVDAGREILSGAAKDVSNGKDAKNESERIIYKAPKEHKEFVTKDGDYTIYRMQLEVMPELWYYGILFVKEDGKKHPFVLSQHGGAGTPKRMGVVGMSYGGMFTLYLTALDTRIRAAFSCSFFNKHYTPQFLDWSYQNAGCTFMDAEMIMLAKPRKIYVAMGDHDNLFLKEDSVEEFERVKEACPDWKEWCDLEIFEGVHEFILTDTWIDKVIEELRR